MERSKRFVVCGGQHTEHACMLSLTYDDQQQQGAGASDGHCIRCGQQADTTQHVDSVEGRVPV